MAQPYTEPSFFVKLYHATLNQVTPAECVHCHREGDWVCAECLGHTRLIHTSTCPFCNKLSPRGATCSRCKSRYKLTGNHAIWYYENAVAELIKQYKYHQLTACLTWLTPYLVTALESMRLPSNALLTSVPSDPARFASRGYNQSELLAQALAQATGRTYQPLLRRSSRGVSQTTLTRHDRLENVRQQFTLRSATPTTKPVIIVDDVITTGATLASCAAILKTAGAPSVWSLTIAKD